MPSSKTAKRPGHPLTSETALSAIQACRDLKPKREAFGKYSDDDAFKLSQADWAFLEHCLLQDAIKLASCRTKKSRQQLHTVVVDAGISHDKRWSKREGEAITLSIPASIERSLRLALQISDSVQTPTTVN